MPGIEANAAALAEDLALIREAAAEAGAIAMSFFGKSPEVWMKPGASPVSEADYAVDRFLREHLVAARPDYGWLSEETADSPDRLSARRTFVVDPIDGTRAYIEGLPTWCVSIAVVENGRPLVGVLDCPVKGEIFLALRGGGATRNGSTIAARGNTPARLGGPMPMLDTARKSLGTGFETIAYVPSLAYRIAMVASGEIDGTFVKANAQDWDLAAADLILEEAGGALIDISGEPLLYAKAVSRHGVLVAGSEPLLADLLSVARRHERSPAR